MSEHPPDRAPDRDGRSARPDLPASYGAARRGTRPDDPAPVLRGRPPQPQQPQPGSDGSDSPVYGRVTRFGQPGGPVGGAPLGQRGWPAPAHAPAAVGQTLPWPPPADAGPGQPLSGPVPWASAPPLWASEPLLWAGPQPPWPATPPPRTREQYASWGRRVVACLIDGVPGLVAGIVLLIGYLPLYEGLFRGDLTAAPSWGWLVAGIVLYVADLGWVFANRWRRAGRTGQSIGKRVMGIWLVGVRDGRPVGVLNAFLRDLLHTVDGVAYVGYLWPLWDEHRQTLADKIIETVVVRTPVPPLTEHERRHRP